MDLCKIDFKREARELYAPPRHPVLVDVPRFKFLMVDGCGPATGSPDFEAAVGLLYTASYSLKFSLKRTLGLDWIVAPLEGLWSSGGSPAFDPGRPADWTWTLMIRQPEQVTAAHVEVVRAQVAAKARGSLLERLRLEDLAEGRCAQVMHIGPYSTEAPAVDALKAFIAAQCLAPAGRHHEIYLSDPNRTAPERIKTILRQPVCARENVWAPSEGEQAWAISSGVSGTA
ncbi:MAG TPA: GyrI-like domain-containing protein [Dehalococcoidia bacterium]|nr:GyrI-like domain-containing protein [Dehalococcoidia bacterium]